MHPAIAFNKISLLVTRQINTDLRRLLNNIKDYLLSQTGTVYVEPDLAHQLADPKLQVKPRAQLASSCDLMIAIGGDGTLLQAAHLAVEYDTPVLGIHQGRLGFLADIQAKNFEQSLGLILQGQYQEEQRFLLEVDILSPQQAPRKEIALNEMALVSGDIARMIEYQVSLGEQFVCRQRADGLIIATPTGSTAYALSGGGPLIHPQLEAFIMVPMFPHSLNARPLVLSANSTLHVQALVPRARNTPNLSCDGRQQIPLPSQATITIRKKIKQLRLIHPVDYQYFKVLRHKMHWHEPNIPL